MVDVATLALEARTDGLLKAEAALDQVTRAAVRTETASSKIKAGFSGAATSAGDAAKQFDQLRASLDPTFAASQRYADVQKEIARLVETGGATQRQANILLEQAASKYMGVATAAERASAAQQQLDRATEQARSSIDQLRASIDPVYASSQRYSRAVDDVNAAVRAGVISQSQANRILAQAETAYLGAGNAADTAAVAMTRARTGAMGAGGGFQNLGYQIQDFAVQVGAGTSATQALGQQLPQLLSGFGMIGIAVGTLSAVALPLLALAFADNADNATALASALDDLTASTEQFRIAAQAIRLGIDEEEVLIVEQINSLTRERIALEAKMSEAYGHQRLILDRQHQSLVAQISTLQESVNKYREARDTAEKLKNEITLGAQAARAAASGVADIGAQAQGAVGRVKNLASALWDAAKAAQARVTLMNEASRNYGKIMNTGDSGPDAAKRSVLGLNAPGVITGVLSSGAAGVYDPGPGAGGGGGGGGAADDGFQSRLDALMEGLQTERDTVDAWYAESMEILNDRRAEELLGAQGHADALLLIEEELQRRKTELRDQDLGHYQSFFGSMAGALRAGGSKMLAISKGFALAEAAVSMWRGAAKALELPFPASLAAWGQVIATGTKALAGIRGASFGGGGGGGGGIGATPVAPVATPSRSLRINVEGEGIFADQLRRSMRVISEALGEERDIGGFVVA